MKVNTPAWLPEDGDRLNQDKFFLTMHSRFLIVASPKGISVSTGHIVCKYLSFMRHVL